MKINILFYTAFILILFAGGCNQEDIIVDPETPIEYDDDETVPQIPEPAGPNVITQLQSEKMIKAVGKVLDEFQATIYLTFQVDDSFGIQRDSSIAFAVKIPKDSAEVFLRHRVYWQNLGSRVLGPGTSYSITYIWLEGSSTTNISEFSYSLGFDASFGGLGLSASMSQSFSSEVSVYTERSTEETQTVTGIDGYHRVFTVWQLINEYDLVDRNGNKITGDVIENIPMIKDVLSSVPEEFPYKFRVVDMPSLILGTSIIYQLTYDFPIKN